MWHRWHSQVKPCPVSPAQPWLQSITFHVSLDAVTLAPCMQSPCLPSAHERRCLLRCNTWEDQPASLLQRILPWTNLSPPKPLHTRLWKFGRSLNKLSHPTTSLHASEPVCSSSTVMVYARGSLTFGYLHYRAANVPGHWNCRLTSPDYSFGCRGAWWVWHR